MTRQLYLNTASCGDYPFSLIDTPGTNAKTEVYKHAYLLREALTTQPINTIFIVIRYDNRFDTILEDYELLEQLVYNYDTKIVVMISHWDLSKAPEKDFAQICQVFKDYCSNIICYSEKSSKRKIANLMYGCMSNMKAESLEINDEDFFLRYNVVEIKRNIKKSLDEYSKMTAKRFREFSDAVMRASSTSTDNTSALLRSDSDNHSQNLSENEFNDDQGEEEEEEQEPIQTPVKSSEHTSSHVSETVNVINEESMSPRQDIKGEYDVSQVIQLKESFQPIINEAASYGHLDIVRRLIEVFL